MFKKKPKTVKKEETHKCSDGPLCTTDCPKDKAVMDAPHDPHGVLEKKELPELVITIEKVSHDFTDSSGVTGAGVEAFMSIRMGNDVLLDHATPSLEDFAAALLSIYGSGKLIRITTTKTVVSKKF